MEDIQRCETETDLHYVSLTDRLSNARIRNLFGSINNSHRLTTGKCQCQIYTRLFQLPMPNSRYRTSGEERKLDINCSQMPIYLIITFNPFRDCKNTFSGANSLHLLLRCLNFLMGIKCGMEMKAVKEQMNSMTTIKVFLRLFQEKFPWLSWST